MRPEEALHRLRALVRDLPPGARLDADPFGNPQVHVRLDMLHLDADALNDRLAAWTARVLRHLLPSAAAFVGFDHARPASHDDATLDVQELWHDLEPTLRLEMEGHRVDEADLAAFARLVPEFLRLVAAAGRPEGWRRWDEGNAE